MTDAPAQPQSYVDNYQPPSPVAGGGMPFQPFQPGQPIQPTPPVAADPGPVDQFTQQPPQAVAPVPAYVAPTPSVQPVAPAAPTAPAASESLEDQNIFDLLGVASATESEKEAFLDELQQVIWEDFLENDVQLLITEDEMAQLRQIMGNNSQDQLAQQEAVIGFLEKLIPDLEEIMLEKALELKSDMVKERITGMREFFANQPEKTSQIDAATSLIQDDQWHSAAQALNSIK